MHKLKVELNGPGRGRVWLDDKRIEAVAVKVEARAGQMNKATIELNIVDAEITGEMELTAIMDLLKDPRIKLNLLPPSIRTGDMQSGSDYTDPAGEQHG